MDFIIFNKCFPDLGENETFSLIITEDMSSKLEPGIYHFLELYCSNPTCDCRNAMIHVVYENHGEHYQKGSLRYCWEERDFYEKIRLMFPEDWEIPGASPDFTNVLGCASANLAQVFNNTCEIPVSDSSKEWQGTYGERIQRHYRMVKEHFSAFVKASRNQPCPCNSGKKYKKCCAQENR